MLYVIYFLYILEIEEQKKQIDVHLDEKNKLTESMRRKSEECAHLRSQVESITNDLLSLKDQFEESLNRYEIAVEESNRRDVEFEELTKMTENLGSANKELNENLERKNDEIKILTQVEEQLKSNLELLEKERENNVMKINGLEDIITQEKTNNEKLSNENNTLQTNIDLLGEELNSQKVKFIELEEKNMNLKTELSDSKDDLERKIKDLQVSESNINQLNIDIKELDIKIEEKDEDIDGLNQKQEEAEKTILIKTGNLLFFDFIRMTIILTGSFSVIYVTRKM